MGRWKYLSASRLTLRHPRKLGLVRSCIYAVDWLISLGCRTELGLVQGH